MGYLSNAEKSRILAQIATKEAQLDAANAAYLAALGSGDVESYAFDSKEGKQSTTLRSPSVLQKMIAQLEAELTRLRQKINGGGICTLALRRG